MDAKMKKSATASYRSAEQARREMIQRQQNNWKKRPIVTKRPGK